MERQTIKKIVRARLKADKNRLNYLEDRTVRKTTGEPIACEEAVLTWQEYSDEQRKQLSDLTDLQIVTQIYSTDFDYLKPSDKLLLVPRDWDKKN